VYWYPKKLSLDPTSIGIKHDVLSTFISYMVQLALRD